MKFSVGELIDNAVFSPENADVIFFGIPFALTSVKKTFLNSPDSIRKAMNLMESYDVEFEVNSFDILKICDLGNISFKDYESMRNNTIKTIRKIKEKNKDSFLFILGGEHLVILPVLEALKNNDIGIITFDAHLDMRNEWEGKKYSYATFTRRLLEHFSQSQIIKVGIRSCSEEEIEETRRIGMKFFLRKEFNVKKIIKTMKKANLKKWFIDIDFDVLDTSYSQSVSTPEAFGVSMEELNSLLKEIFKNFEVIGADVCEITSENLDATCINAAAIIMKMLSYLSLKKLGKAFKF